VSAGPIGILCVTAHSDRPEAETFIGLRARGFDLRVLCASGAPYYRRLEAAGVPVAPLDIVRRFDGAAVLRIRAELTGSTRYRILHLFNNKAVLNGLRAVRGLDDIKVVAYRGIVGNDSFLSPASWLRYLNPRVDRIVCVADAVRAHYLRLGFGRLRVPPRKLVRIYKGHDLEWYRDPPADLTLAGVPAGAFVAGCVANWRPRKGLETLVRAHALLPAELSIHLALIGRMDGRSLAREIAASPARDRVHLLGYRRDAPAVIAACDAAVLPSRKREGLPKTVIEAMAYGVPPIVTSVGGSPELVEPGDSGLVVPPGDANALADALLELYRQPERRREMGKRARRRIATHFSIRATIEQTARLYEELSAEDVDAAV
jgi:glycosyltransferase involved in cell wall biosynthesis